MSMTTLPGRPDLPLVGARKAHAGKAGSWTVPDPADEPPWIDRAMEGYTAGEAGRGGFGHALGRLSAAALAEWPTVALRGQDAASGFEGAATSETALVSADPLRAIDWGSRLSTRTVDVYFAPAGTFVDAGTSLGWTAFERKQIMLALEQVETVTNLRFRVTDSQAGAEFRFATGYLDGAAAFMIPPGEQYAGLGVFDVGFLSLIDADSGKSLFLRGGFGFAVMLEEIGHGLGLAHMHDTGGSSTILKGVTAPIGSYGVGQLNQGVYTVMGYNDGWPAGPNGTAYLTGSEGDYTLNVNDFGYEATMMAVDVAVLQRKYGANRDHATRNDIYLLPDGNGAGTFFQCIWDAGGSDTMRYDGARDVTLDLRPATLAGATGGGGYVSHAANIRGGFTIAKGVTIETAIGGAGDDRIIGNATANVLQGRLGNDRLDGAAGADRMVGGRGNDTYVVDNAGDVVVEYRRGGSDRIDASVSFTLPGQVETLALTGTADLRGTGNAGANTLIGNAGDNRLDGAAGADRMVGGRGNDTYVVDNAGDVVAEYRRGGSDRIDASVSFTLPGQVETLALTGTANLRGTGNAGANTLIGNAGANALDGGVGADRIIGGLGTDRLAGCTGADVFVFRSVAESPAGPECDTIVDFETGLDLIDLSAIDACTIGSGGQTFVFIGADPFSGTPGELRYAEGRVAGDVTGDGAADLEISIANLAAITIDDFIL